MCTHICLYNFITEINNIGRRNFQSHRVTTLVKGKKVIELEFENLYFNFITSMMVGMRGKPIKILESLMAVQKVPSHEL